MDINIQAVGSIPEINLLKLMVVLKSMRNFPTVKACGLLTGCYPMITLAGTLLCIIHILTLSGLWKVKSILWSW